MAAIDGQLISIEGIDGAGKTKQTELLAEKLRQSGAKVITTFEPGGGDDGVLLRQLLASNGAQKQRGDWGPETEALLFTAARRHHLDTCILPAMRQGKVVITDRFADSTRVYQGFGNPRLQLKINQLHELMIGIEPDWTFIIDIPAQLAVSRVTERSGGDARLEAFGEQLEELRQDFITLGRRYQERCRIVDGNRPVNVIANEIFEIVSG